MSVLEGDQAYNRKEYDLACAKYTEVLRKVQKMNTDEAANLVCRKAAVYMQQGNYDAVTRIFSYTFWETYDSHRWMRMQVQWPSFKAKILETQTQHHRSLLRA